MRIKLRFIWIIFLLTTICVNAQNRSETELKSMAAEFFNSQKSMNGQKAREFEEVPEQLEVTIDKANVAVVTNSYHGLVVLPKDSRISEVLGYSDSFGDVDNLPPGFTWWLEAINKSITNAGSRNKTRTNASLMPKDKVAPLLTTKWGQGKPFNNQCPQLNGQHCVTGCVATALAQICNYHHYPERGHLSNVYDWTDGGKEISMDFGNVQFNYDKMLDDYTKGYTKDQASAVSSLMEVCGKGCDMQYGLDESGVIGSCGALYKIGAALVNYLDFPFLMTIIRGYIDNEVWMGRIFSNLSRGLPIYYAGGSHAFVLDGYDAYGNIHVNWGWDGRFDGYFSIDLLNPDGQNYNNGEEIMVCDIRPNDTPQQVIDVTVSQAGSLTSVVNESDVLYADRLKITGDLNGTDFKYLQSLISSGRLLDLDLTDANVVAGGDAYPALGENHYTSDAVLPFGVFDCCEYLGAIKLPKSLIKIEPRSLAMNYLVDVTIPASVMQIDSLAFFDSKSHLRHIRVDEGNKVFNSSNGCNAIIKTATNEVILGCQSSIIPEGVTTIGDGAFQYCRWMKTISLPNSLKRIGNDAFSLCESLKDINIPEGVISIGSNAFNECYMSQLKLPSTLTAIGDYAFRYNTFNSFIIPQNVETIGHGILTCCSELVSVTVEEGNPYFDSRDNCNGIVRTADHTLVQGIKSTVISSSLKGIGDYAYYEMDINSMDIPDGVTTIGDYAFSMCAGLASVMIPKSVTTIGSRAFENTVISSIVIPEGMTIINDAFVSCDYLETVSLPQTLRTIGNSAFAGCESLKSITIPQGVEDIQYGAFHGCYSLKEVRTYMETPEFVNCFSNYDATLYVPKGTKSRYEATGGWKEFSKIEEFDAFGGEIRETTVDGIRYSLNTATKTATVMNGDYEDLKEVNIHSSIKDDGIDYSVKRIGNSAFEWCSYIESVHLPEGIETIGKSAFYYSSIKELELPSSLTWIGDEAFKECSLLTIVLSHVENPFVLNENAFYEEHDGDYVNGNNYAIMNKTPFTSAVLIVPQGSSAKYKSSDVWKDFPAIFEGDGELNTTVVGRLKYYYVSNSDVAIVKDIFEDDEWYSDNHKSIVVPSTVTINEKEYQVKAIGNNALGGWSIEKIEMPSTLSSIGRRAFQNCNSLETITIPKGVTYIGSEVFEYCNDLKSIQVEAGNTCYFSLDGILYDRIHSELLKCPLQKQGKVVIPSGIKSIAPKACMNCEGITSVTIPEGVSVIRSRAFSNCSGITYLTIPSTVELFGSSCFPNSENLEYVKSYIMEPFKMESYYLGFAQEDWSTGKRVVVPSQAILYVPEGMVPFYKATGGWKDCFSAIEEMPSVSITIGSANQVPYYSDQNLDFTNKPDLKAYVATGYDKSTGTIWLTRVKQVPANTGFLLMGDAGDYDIPVVESVADCYYKNMFKGTIDGETIQTTDGEYTNYYLSKGASGVGFYKVTKAEGQSIGANRCYLPILTDIPANGSEGDTEVIKVGAALQVPYYTSKNLDFSTMDAQGVKAYTATGYNYGTGTIWLTRVKQVPAHTGVLVMANEAGNYEVPTASVAITYENMFVGSETAQTIYTNETIEGVDYVNYYLSSGASGLGFYKVTKEEGVKMGANRCYLPIPNRDSASGARGMRDDASFSEMVFSDNDDDVIAIPVYGSTNGDDDGTTGIENNNREPITNNLWYNLQGQRVENPGKGIYIRNGRKVVIK